MSKVKSQHVFAFPGDPTSLAEISVELAERCIDTERKAIEAALCDWCDSCGVSPQEFGQHYGYTVARDFGEPERPTFTVKVTPVLLGNAAPEWGARLPTCGSGDPVL